jgi:hypothetical protein
MRDDEEKQSSVSSIDFELVGMTGTTPIHAIGKSPNSRREVDYSF